MALYNVIFVGYSKDGTQYFNSALYLNGDPRCEVVDQAKRDVDFWQRHNGYVRGTVIVIDFEEKAVRELLDGKASKASLEERTWPDVVSG